jgi:renalase
MAAMVHDVVVVGAGVSGLTLARALRSGGLEPVVIERARGVGGRCATRRVEGQAVDHGVPFLHGRDPRFLAELAAVAGATPVPGWPLSRVGEGLPCRPEAFGAGDERLAFREGVSRLPKHLAAGLDVRLGTDVVALRRAADPAAPGRASWELELAPAGTLRARAVALALPAPSMLRLLRPAAERTAAIAGVLPLLELVRTQPCLAVIARYGGDAPRPGWEAAFPAGSEALQAVLHDSSKRAAGARLTLVLQARAAWSRRRLGAPAEAWSGELLAEAAARHGDWISRPSLQQAHVWHHARVAAGCELAGPVALRLDDGGVLGLCGDGFAPAGGLEAAYLSGLALASRIQPLDHPPTP